MHPHIHIDGILTRNLDPSDLLLYKKITEEQSTSQEFTFTLKRLLQDENYNPMNPAIDGYDTSFGTQTLTATIPAGEDTAIIDGNDTKIGFGYYEVTENTNANWLYDSLMINGNEYSPAPIYIRVTTEGTVSYSRNPTSGFNFDDESEVTFVNAPVPKIDITASKIWNDNENSDGIRPSSITLYLLANDSPTGKSATLSAGEDGVWDTADLTYTWTNLPEVDSNGRAIAYTVVEENVTGYTWTLDTDGSHHTVTNTHILETTSVHALKIWDDDHDRDSKRPDSIELELYADGVATGKKATLSAEGHWKATWTDLQKYASGKVGVPINYTVVETSVPEGYSVEYSTDELTGVLNVTNKHPIATTTYTVEKVWDDANNQDKKRPAEISVQLYANGSPYGEAVTLNQDNNWTYTWSSLPKNEAGKAITYTVAETTVPNGYTSVVDGNTITNTHEIEKISVTATKIWNDNNDQDGIRPDSVEVELYADGVATGKTLSLNAADNWTADFTGLPRYKEGEVGVEVKYTIKETTVPTGYDDSYSEDGLTVTNTHIPATHTLTVRKEWDDAENQDSKRPYAVQITLYKSGLSTGKTAVVREGSWEAVWEGMPVYEGGHLISYTVAETGYWMTAAEYTANSVTPPYAGTPAGYTSVPTYDHTDPDAPVATITNSYTPEKTFVNVVKSWDDNNNQDGMRPGYVVVELLADGEPTGKTVTLNSDNEWDQTFTDLDKYKDGKEIEYTVKEVTTVANYEDPTYNYDRIDNIVTVTNKHTPEKTSYSITKVWDDNDNQDGKRPTTIKLTLHANGVEAVVPEGHEWGKDHTVTITLSAGDDGVWQDNELTATWNDLARYYNGKEIVYSAVEEAIADYTATYDTTSGTHYVKNSHTPAVTSITVSKVWNDASDQDGIRPQQVNVTLYKKVGENSKTKVDSYTLKRGEGWVHTFMNLPVYEGGQLISYSVEEDAVTDYTSSVNGFIITNTHIPETTTVQAKKVWVDEGYEDARPDSITLLLYVGDQQVGEEKTITKDDWSATVKWENLPKYAGGNEINYLVYEKQDTNMNPAYGISYSYDAGDPTDPSDDFYVVTNTYNESLTGLTVEKVWNDSNNQDGKRPDSVIVGLYTQKNDTLTAVADPTDNTKNWVITLSSDNHWAYTFHNIPMHESDGTTLVTYVVREVELVNGSYEIATSIGGYTVSYGEDITTGFKEVINSYVPEKTTYSVTKVWDDEDDQDGIRPESITVALYANGVSLAGQEWTSEDGKTSYTGTITLSAGDDGVWQDNELTAEWVNLSKYYNGKQIIYSAHEVVESGSTWVEHVPDGYTASLIGNTITNTHPVYKTSVTVNKKWVDDEDRDDKRPDSITVQLYANDKPEGSPVTLSKDNDWSYTWTGLDLNADGDAITYTVRETDVPEGYDVSYSSDGLTITNTHEIDTKDLNVIKVWEDDENRDSKRPYAVQITLYANGYATANTLILHQENNWTGKWESMPVNEGGKEINYTIVETGYFKTDADLAAFLNGDTTALQHGAPDGYSVVYSYDLTTRTATATNSYTPAKTSLNVVKRWDDEYDRDAIRPYAIQVTLKKGQDLTDQTLVLTADDEWDKTFIDLPVYEAGNTDPLVYTAVETGYWMTKADYESNTNFVGGIPSGYEVGDPIHDTSLRLLTIINKHEVATTSFTASKDWYDYDNNDGKRPVSITLTLHANGVSLADRQWTSADGKTTYTGTVTLTANSDPNGEVNVWDDSELSAYWGNLKLNYNGNQISYSVVETAVAGYTTDPGTAIYENNVWTQVITNSRENETTSIPVSKVWDDNGNQDGKRPASIEVELYADGMSTGKKLTLDANNLWQDVFSDLDVYKGGQEIVYTVKESAVPGYEVVGADQDGRVGVVNGRITITNHHDTEETQIKVTKVWDDNNNQDGKRPNKITLYLEADGIYTQMSVELTAGSDGIWQAEELTHTWTGLPKYADGKEIDYTVFEEPVMLENTSADAVSRVVDRYTVTYGRDPMDSNHVIVTNSYTPETTEVAVMKVWDDMDNRDGVRPAEVTVQLYKNGIAVDASNKVLDTSGNEISGTAKLNQQNEWITYWIDLPKYEAGELISWSIDEIHVPDSYESSREIHPAVPGVTVITNSHEAATTHVTVTKIWEDEKDNDGIRPENITVQLYANNVAIEDEQAVLSEDNGWSYTFTRTGLDPLYVFEAGNPISYTVKEVTVPDGYEDSSEVTKTEGTNVTFHVEITNTHTIERTSLKVTKQWRDEDNNDGIRPETVTLTLYANGSPVTAYTDSKGNTVQGTVTLSEETGLSYTWVDLYAYQGGEAVTYEVREDNVPEGYNASYSYVTTAAGTDWTVVNTHIIEQKEITITKKWVDDNDAEGLRPTSITAQMYKNGSAYGDAFVITAADNWTYTVDVPVYENGKEIVWTVRELAVPRYYTVSYNQNTVTITNTIQSKEVADTGDDTGILFWLGMMMLSFTGAAAIVISEQKKRRKA